MFILLDMDYMADLKLSSYKDLLIILFAIFYTANLLNTDVIIYNRIKEDLFDFLDQHLYEDTIRPDIIYMLITFPNKYIQEITLEYLIDHPEYLSGLEEYLKERKYLEQFETYLK